MNQHAFFMDVWMVKWIVMAFLAGFIFGYGAWIARHGKGLVKYIRLNLMPAVFFSEGMYKVIHIQDYMHMKGGIAMTVCIGILLYAMMNRRKSFRWRNLVSFLGLSVLGILGFTVPGIILD